MLRPRSDQHTKKKLNNKFGLWQFTSLHKCISIQEMITPKHSKQNLSFVLQHTWVLMALFKFVKSYKFEYLCKPVIITPTDGLFTPQIHLDNPEQSRLGRGPTFSKTSQDVTRWTMCLLLSTWANFLWSIVWFRRTYSFDFQHTKPWLIDPNHCGADTGIYPIPWHNGFS